MTAKTEIIKAAADKLMGWKLPQDFYPDCHISFDREKASQSPHGWPTGTNLLHHQQAQDMFKHCIGESVEALLGLFISCRPSVRNDCNTFDRFMERKYAGSTPNDCDADEQKRLYALLDAIDAAIEANAKSQSPD